MSRITQKGATSPLEVNAGGSFQVSTDANLASLVGARFDLADGREVILVSNGSTAIGSAGVLIQDAAIVSNHQNCAIASYVAYSANGNVPASLVATLGGTKADVNQYQGGFVVVNAGPGQGQILKIASNAFAASSSSLAIVLEDAPNTALTGASKVCILPPHAANCVINPVTPTGAVVGLSLYPIAAGQAAGLTAGTPSFAFALSKGVGSCYSDVLIPAAGLSISPSLTVSGAITASTGTQASVGYAVQAGVSAESRAVFIDL